MDDREYRVEELAAEAGIPVRTLRYYQERRLLPAPRRAGRVALYSTSHLDRLRLIARLLDRGYRLDGIEELLAAAGQRQDVTELLGFEWAAAAPWSERGTVALSLDELSELLDGQVTAEVLAEAAELGHITLDGDRVVVNSPRLLDATAQLVRAGIPLPAILAVTWELEAAFDRMAFSFVELVRGHLLGRLGDEPSPDELDRLAELVGRMRPVARTVADEHFARAMDRRLSKEVARIRQRIRPTRR
ncbi:MerR family transcriptional regulator [Actinomadura rubrisoli]|uniref:MerR family transcriptional regulator n=1 Tax=Actinomadura rubrisoli TaxID=2530368 RepID=A0A4R5AFD5_9ACTN|nr:MerR family transcriptional regulator [Actinomadura rubrisoli]TDD69594.1 MerR family transcriptional regulator [Actinomadura rubrisoli]